MRILIIEDQEEKSKDIVKFLSGYYDDELDISQQLSLRSGLGRLVSGEGYDLIVLDMSMPNFDPSLDDPIGGTPESFAGKEFLSQMKLRGISIPVVVITQYATFAKGQIALEDLDNEFRASYSEFYLGSVYYSYSSHEWKKALSDLLEVRDE